MASSALESNRSFAGSAILLVLALGYGLTLGMIGPLDWLASALREGSMRAAASVGADGAAVQLGAALIGPLILPLAALTFAWGSASLPFGQLTGAWLTHVCVNQSLFVVGSAPESGLGEMASSMRVHALTELNLLDHSFTLSAILFGIGFLVFTLTLTMPLFTGAPSAAHQKTPPRTGCTSDNEPVTPSAWMTN